MGRNTMIGFTVSRALKWWAWEKPDRVALNYEGEPVTYAGLYDWGLKVADWLRGQGVAPGDRVMMVAENSLEYAVLLVGTVLAGAIAAPVTFRSSVRELQRAVDLLTPRLVLADAGRMEACRAALGPDGAARLRPMEPVRAMRDGPAPAPAHTAAPEDAMFIIGTSGSTGAPKGVVYTQGATMAYAAEFAIMEPATGNGGSVLAAGPYSSSSGTLLLFQFLSVGATIFAENRFAPERALALLSENRITAFLASTVFFERLAALPEFDAADLSALAFAQIGGARVGPTLTAKFRAKGVVLRQAYGCTEAGGAWAARDETALTDTTKCGPGGLFSEYAVVRPDGTLAEPDEPGEILIRSAAMASGYWNDPEQTATSFRDGWLHTGDRGKLDARGNLTFIDRIKDIIKSGGLNVSAMEVENTIAEVDGVVEVVVLAVEDAEFGETPLAVVHGDVARLDARGILAHCRRELASYKVPRYVALEAEALPRLPSGKIDRSALRARFAQGTPTLERIR
jgi:fatty-acyl-CoA synthase